MEYKAKLINGILEVFPNVESVPNADGGTDVKVNMINPQIIQMYKNEIISKLMMGEKVDIEVLTNG